MIRCMVIFFVPVLLAGRISSSPAPPPSTTIVVSQGSTAVCANGQTPPC
jgi:hypothetical protein